MSEGREFRKVKAGWWAAIYDGQECGRGGLRQVFLRAFGRLPTDTEVLEMQA